MVRVGLLGEGCGCGVRLVSEGVDSKAGFGVLWCDTVSDSS